MASSFQSANAILAFKCIYGRAPEYLNTIFTKRRDINRNTTRRSQLFTVPLLKLLPDRELFITELSASGIPLNRT